MEARLAQLRTAAEAYIPRGDVESVLWNKERGADALPELLYGPVDKGGLGLVPPIDTPKGA